jgi:hypothetical protein
MGLDAVVFCDCVEKKRLKRPHPFLRREDDKKQSLVHCHSWGILTVVEGEFRLSSITGVGLAVRVAGDTPASHPNVQRRDVRMGYALRQQIGASWWSTRLDEHRGHFPN